MFELEKPVSVSRVRSIASKVGDTSAPEDALTTIARDGRGQARGHAGQKSQSRQTKSGRRSIRRLDGADMSDDDEDALDDEGDEAAEDEEYSADDAEQDADYRDPDSRGGEFTMETRHAEFNPRRRAKELDYESIARAGELRGTPGGWQRGGRRRKDSSKEEREGRRSRDKRRSGLARKRARTETGQFVSRARSR